MRALRAALKRSRLGVLTFHIICNEIYCAYWERFFDFGHYMRPMEDPMASTDEKRQTPEQMMEEFLTKLGTYVTPWEEAAGPFARVPWLGWVYLRTVIRQISPAVVHAVALYGASTKVGDREQTIAMQEYAYSLLMDDCGTTPLPFPRWMIALVELAAYGSSLQTGSALQQPTFALMEYSLAVGKRDKMPAK